ncbi:hypothetical protein Tco_0856400 [Tanacetum coccineum]|uniref:Uncharacterized protein n=1 Tax=Tanacetum coccineum TaxID=301880 RepID=A0ABQ5B6E4_9ASTR
MVEGSWLLQSELQWEEVVLFVHEMWGSWLQTEIGVLDQHLVEVVLLSMVRHNRKTMVYWKDRSKAMALLLPIFKMIHPPLLELRHVKNVIGLSISLGCKVTFQNVKVLRTLPVILCSMVSIVALVVGSICKWSSSCSLPKLLDKGIVDR